jgi:hypothetical protein
VGSGRISAAESAAEVPAKTDHACCDSLNQSEVLNENSICVAFFLLDRLLVAASVGDYHLLKKISIPGDGTWGHLAVDEGARRLYVSHGTQVNVIDLDSEQVAGSISELKECMELPWHPAWDVVSSPTVF